MLALSGDSSRLSLTVDSDLPLSLFFLSSTLMKCSMSSALIRGALSGTFLRIMTALLWRISSGRMQCVISFAAKPLILRQQPRLTDTRALGELTRIGLKENCK